MSDEQPNGRVTTKQVYDLLSAHRTEWRAEFEKLGVKVDLIRSRQYRLDGALSMLKWLGPAGVGAVLVGLLKMGGFV
jgi:hypothetical protein